MWVLANSHFHDHEKNPCSSNSLECDHGVMEEFDTRNEVNIRRRANRRILNDSGGIDEKVSSLISEDSNKSDYAASDPPPVAKIPTNKTVHYRIFSRPPVASPPSDHL
ncbi:hypothetical protein SUGI_0087850 [Cryptomeria japonica]|nr:hypothetical protein SUGI_0087850 [Cryptomeria japonica]